MTVPDTSLGITQQLAQNERDIDLLRGENHSLKQQIKELSNTIQQLINNYTNNNIIEMENPLSTQTNPLETTTTQKAATSNTRKTVSQTPAIKEAAKNNQESTQTPINNYCFQKKQQQQQHSATLKQNNPLNKINTNNFNNTATLICGYTPSVEEANNIVKQVTSTLNTNIWFPNEKPNVIQFQFENELDMQQGINIMNSLPGNQWATPAKIPNFKNLTKGYGDSIDINSAIQKLGRVITVIKSKKLTSAQISFTKTKDTTPKYKIIVMDDNDKTIDAIEEHSFSAVKKNKGIPKETNEYNHTCIITFPSSIDTDKCTKTIESIFQNSHVQFKDEYLKYNENTSKFKEGEKYHHYSYLCENEDDVNNLIKTSIVIQGTSKKLNRKFKRYGDTKRNNTTYTPYPNVQPPSQDTFNFNVNPATDAISALTERVNNQEKDIKEIKEDNKEIKSTISSIQEMVKTLLEKSNTSKPSAGSGRIGGMDLQHD